MGAKLIAFLAAYLDKTGTGTTPENRGQCVGLVELWLLSIGAPVIWGNAIDLLRNADPRNYIVTRNSPTNHPNAGDVIVWDASFGGGYGHTAIVLAGTPSRVAVFEQNNPTHSAPTIATHAYTGVQGWLTVKIPKVTV